MPYTPFSPIPIGSLAWGGPVNTGFTNLDEAQGTVPLDQALMYWSFDPATNMVGTAITSGTVNMAKLWIRQPTTVNTLSVGITAAGSALVAGQNFLGLYDAAGNQLGVTADQTANWGTTGYKQAALTAPAPVSAGAHYVALLSNATTTPSFARGSALTSSIANANLTAADGRFTTGPVGQTTLPVSITMGARSLTGNALWVGMG